MQQARTEDNYRYDKQDFRSRHSDHHIPLAEAEEATSKEEKTDRNNGE